jgi:hypothetical protein
MNKNPLPPSSKEEFAGKSFVDALDEYTRRIEASAAELESDLEVTLSRLFGILVFMMLLAGLLPLIIRASEDLLSGPIYRTFLQATMTIAILTIFGLIAFTLYIRLIRIRRRRRNLETLLWPYQKLLQKLSQIVDQGNLDEGTSTLIQLKMLEAEVAFGRARRLARQPRSLVSLFGIGIDKSSQVERWEVKMLAEQYRIPTDDAEVLLHQYGNDRERLYREAENLSRR